MIVAIAAGLAIVALAWIGVGGDAGLVPAEVPEIPALALDAASVELFADVKPPRLSASLLAADALRSSSGRELGGARRYALAMWLALHRTPPEALAIALWAMPFGEDCTGIEDAALRYMHQPLRQLDAAKLAALAVLARAPAELLADPERWRGERDALLRKLRDHGALDDARVEEALSRPVVPATWEVRPR